MHFSILIRFSIGFFLLIYWSNCFSQTDYVVVENVSLFGNKKTNDKIIFKELDVFPGDTIFLNEMAIRLEKNEKRILNTGLFTLVNINIKNWNTENKTLDLEIDLQENWYIYPGIIFELADRNFNVWWKEQNHSFDRVNFGIRLDHINFTGNKDYFKAKLQFGYTRKYEVKYERPYLSKNWGYATSIFYSENKEIGYKTILNKTVFEKTEDERILLRRFRIGTAVNYRPTPYLFQSLRFEYHRNSIDDFVADTLNPDYFLNGTKRIHFFLLEYNIQFDRRVYHLYPESGYRVFGTFKKEGLGVFGDFNNLSFEAGYEKFFRVTSRLVLTSRMKVKANLIRKQLAFANNTGLGYYGNIITGYELYVIDGTDFLLTKSSLRFNLIKKQFAINKYMPLDQFKKMDFKAYFRLNLDVGYVNEPYYKVNNPLNNQWLAGYGPALDFILYNNFLISLEYSFNEIGDNGFFIQSLINF